MKNVEAEKSGPNLFFFFSDLTCFHADNYKVSPNNTLSGKSLCAALVGDAAAPHIRALVMFLIDFGCNYFCNNTLTNRLSQVLGWMIITASSCFY